MNNHEGYQMMKIGDRVSTEHGNGTIVETASIYKRVRHTVKHDVFPEGMGRSIFPKGVLAYFEDEIKLIDKGVDNHDTINTGPRNF